MEEIKEHVKAFIIFGLDNIDKNATSEYIYNYLNTIIETLKPSSDTNVFISGGGTEKQLLLAKSLNALITFETDYPFRLANEGIALNF